MNRLGKVAVVIVAMACVATNQASADIISGDLYTDDGKAVDLSGLEWLSFDDSELGTFNVSRQAVETTGSSWLLDGWRYATVDEFTNLIESLGLTQGFSDSNKDGIDFILNAWGSFTLLEDIFATTSGNWGDYTITRSEYDIARGMYGNVTWWDASDVAIFDEAINEYWDIADPTFPDISTGGPPRYLNFPGNRNITVPSRSFGSFLVRDTVSVPEPGTLALLGIGLFGMGLARRRKKI